MFDHILVRHEQAAAHAAQGYARVSGDVGVCLVTSGPGATNTLTGVADAMMDSTPIVVIAGQVGVGALGTDAFQEVDLVGVAQPITKWAYQIRRPEDVAWAVSRAFYIARSGRPGPVVLDFPKNAQNHTCEWNPIKVDNVRSYNPYPAIDSSAIEEAAKLINGAKKPFALVGQGVELGNAQNELVEFLEKADIPAGRTLLGLSALPTDHPLDIGMLGMHGSYAANMKTQECDVLIAIGMRFGDRVTGLPSTYAKQAKIIHLDIDASEINKNIKADVAVLGNCKETLPAISNLLNENNHQAWRDSFKKYDDMETEKVIEPGIHPTEGPLLMGEVTNVVAEVTNGEAVLVNDVGQNPNIYENLSVYDNLEMSFPRGRNVFGALFFRRTQDVEDRIQEIAAKIFLTDLLQTPAALLSHGQKQWLEIGMLLMQDPELLMLDEPVAGMSVSEREQTAQLLKEISLGRSVLVIEHDMEFVKTIADKVTVLHQGKILAAGKMDDVQNDSKVIEVYLGH